MVRKEAVLGEVDVGAGDVAGELEPSNELRSSDPIDVVDVVDRGVTAVEAAAPPVCRPGRGVAATTSSLSSSLSSLASPVIASIDAVRDDVFPDSATASLAAGAGASDNGARPNVCGSDWGSDEASEAEAEMAICRACPATVRRSGRSGDDGAGEDGALSLVG